MHTEAEVTAIPAVLTTIRARRARNTTRRVSDVESHVIRTRAEQGLPPTVEDPAALADIASIARPALTRARRRPELEAA